MKKLLFIVLISISVGVFADSNSYSPAYKLCLDKSGGVTVDVMDCIETEYKIQDARLTTNYKMLMGMLSGKTKQSLIDSQRLWIKHREATCDMYPKISSGTMFTLLTSQCYLSETTNRVNYLESLINN